MKNNSLYWRLSTPLLLLKIQVDDTVYFRGVEVEVLSYFLLLSTASLTFGDNIKNCCSAEALNRNLSICWSQPYLTRTTSVPCQKGEIFLFLTKYIFEILISAYFYVFYNNYFFYLYTRILCLWKPFPSKYFPNVWSNRPWLKTLRMGIRCSNSYLVFVHYENHSLSNSW